jgi:hypothetical protein
MVSKGRENSLKIHVLPRLSLTVLGLQHRDRLPHGHPLRKHEQPPPQLRQAVIRASGGGLPGEFHRHPVIGRQHWKPGLRDPPLAARWRKGSLGSLEAQGGQWQSRNLVAPPVASSAGTPPPLPSRSFTIIEIFVITGLSATVLGFHLS